MEKNWKYFFLPYVLDLIHLLDFLSRFQFEGKNDVWISQVKLFKHVFVYIFLSFFSQQFSNYLKLKTILWNRIGMYATSKIFGLIVSLWKICYWQMGRVFYLFGAKKMLWKMFIGCFVLVLLAFSRPSDFPIGIIKLNKNSWSRRLQLLLH